jgi:hypothetical protein
VGPIFLINGILADDCLGQYQAAQQEENENPFHISPQRFKFDLQP